MMLNKMGRVALASSLSLALALGATACNRDYTVAFVYMTTAKSTTGLIDAYAVDYQSGALTQLADSPIATSGKNPVAIITSPNGLYVYVVQRDDSSIEEFAVGTDGKLYPQTTYSSTGSFPLAAVVEPGNKFLYVVNTYQNGPNNTTLYTPASPGPGSISIFPINSDNSLGTPTTVNIGNNPIGVTASLFNHFLYVVDQEPAGTTGSAVGQILGFSINTSTGALTPAPGTNITADATGRTIATGYARGVTPSTVLIDPTSRFVYVSDQSTNQIYGSIVNSDGSLVPMVNSPFITGQFPLGMTIDPRGKYLYVANYVSNSVGAYAINTADGTLTASVGSTSFGTDTGPTCVTVESALGIYLYTSNSLGNTVTGAQLDPHNGALTSVQNTPFAGSSLPTCLTSVPNGDHTGQIIVP